MKTRAKDLKRGDVFRMHVYGEVMLAEPIAGGKRIKVRIALEDQGWRANGGPRTGNPRAGDVEFTDEGSVLEFLCKPGRAFHIIEGDDDDNDGDGEPVDDSPSPSILEPV